MRGANFGARSPDGGVTLVSYGGELAAVSGATRCYLAPHIEELGDDHPLTTFVVLMCAYAERVRSGHLPGRYADELAELFARSLLIDDDEFLELDANRYDDDLLAGHFGVPVEQVAAKRRDLAD